jgi:flavin-dependent dehydrogenase
MSRPSDVSSSQSSPFDAVIVGAGPAGAAAAARMAESGLKVALIERADPGRPRVCGGFLGPEFEDWMGSWGWADELGLLAKSPVSTVQISGSGPRLVAAKFADKNGYAVDRGVFDRWAADLAVRKGAELRTQTTAEAVGRDEGIWTVRLQPAGELKAASEFKAAGELIRARHWIDATGRRPASAAKKQVFFACKAVYRGVEGLGGSAVALHFVERGHIGLNPVNAEETTLCLCVDSRYLRDARGDQDRMMETFLAQSPSLRSQLIHARRVTAWHSCQAEPDGDPIFFKDEKFHVGDAVSMVNPVIGGGIPIAMQSGVLLANFLTAADRADRTEFAIAAEYERAWTKAFSKKFTFGAWIGAAERSAFASRAVMGAISAAPAILPRLVRMSRPLPSR